MADGDDSSQDNGGQSASPFGCAPGLDLRRNQDAGSSSIDDGGGRSVARGSQLFNTLAPPCHDTYPTLPKTDSTVGGEFNLSSQDYQLTVEGAIEYVKGWMQFLISLGSTVPANTAGGAGVNWGAAVAGTFSGSDWRFAQADTNSPTGYTYWDGSAWKNVPATWSDPTSTLLYPIGIWHEGDANHAQVGNAWPSAIPEWTAKETALRDKVLPKWKKTIESVWSNQFDLKNKNCPSLNNTCCRYHVQALIIFTEVAKKGAHTLVLAGNNARSNSGSWSLGSDAVNMPAHEFGHHLGNPDEYVGGVGVDASMNGDGAVNGIDRDSLMGQNMTTLKKRHFITVGKELSSMVDAAAKKCIGFVFEAVPPAC